MSRARIPHLRLPVRSAIGKDGTERILDVVEQDDWEEVSQCARVLIATIEGERPVVPEIGGEDPSMFVGEPSIQGAVERVTKYDPRITSEVIEQVLGDVTVGVHS